MVNLIGWIIDGIGKKFVNGKKIISYIMNLLRIGKEYVYRRFSEKKTYIRQEMLTVSRDHGFPEIAAETAYAALKNIRVDSCCAVAGIWKLSSSECFTDISGNISDPTTVSGVGSITFDVIFTSPNRDPEYRSALITIEDPCGNKGYFVAVQKGITIPPALELLLSSYSEIVAETINATIGNIRADSPYCPASGIWKLSSSKCFTAISCNRSDPATVPGTGNIKFDIVFTSPNTGTEPRSALITVEDPSGNKGYFTAVQRGISISASLMLKASDAAGGPDKYTETVAGSWPADQRNVKTSPTHVVRSSYCTVSGNCTYEILSGIGLTSSDTDVEVTTSDNNCPNAFSVTFKTPNTGTKPRVVVVKVKDACNNTTFFTAVQRNSVITGGESEGEIGSFTPGYYGYSSMDAGYHSYEDGMIFGNAGKKLPGGVYRVYIWVAASLVGTDAWNYAGPFIVHYSDGTCLSHRTDAVQRYGLSGINTKLSVPRYEKYDSGNSGTPLAPGKYHIGDVIGTYICNAAIGTTVPGALQVRIGWFKIRVKKEFHAVMHSGYRQTNFNGGVGKLGVYVIGFVRLNEDEDRNYDWE